MYHLARKVVLHPLFSHFIIVLIVINGITMGLETSLVLRENYGVWFETFNTLVIAIFTVEILLRIYVHKIDFFKDGWSLFDLLVVVLSLIPASAGFEIFRILRVLRLFRLITVVPQMRRIVSALLSVIPGIASIAGLLMLFFYIFSIMATQLYGERFPEWFGTLGASFYTLFQIMTLESWSMGIVRPVMEVYPWAWSFFVPFIFLSTFIIINLIIAIVVDAMNEINATQAKEVQNTMSESEKILIREIKDLKNQIELLQKKIEAKSQSPYSKP